MSREINKAGFSEARPPGHPDLVEIGCTCPRMQDALGPLTMIGSSMGIPVTANGERVYAVAPWCPVHTREVEA
jgi:hypothetical protein